MTRLATCLKKIQQADYSINLLIVFVLGLIVYRTSFQHSWTYDDWQVIVQNPDIQSAANFFRDTYPGRPLRELSYMLDRWLFGMDPKWWHLQNIFWHTFNASLVFAFARRLTGKKHVSWFASLLFLVHPAHVEVVANLSHRKDSLSLAFSLLSILAFINFFHSEKNKKVLFGLACACFVIALYAKQNAVAVPIVSFAYVALYSNKLKKTAKLYRLFLVLLFSLGALIFFYHYSSLFNSSSFYEIGKPLLHKYGYKGDFNVYIYYLMVFKSFAFLLSKLIWPFELGVEYYYGVPDSFSDPWVVSGVVFLSLFFAGFFFFKRVSPNVAFLMLFFAAFWLPTSNLWPSAYFAADRYLYAPSVGLFILLACVIEKLKLSPCLKKIGIQFALLASFASLTIQQNAHWKSDETLYLHSLKLNPESAFICNELGKYYYNLGNYSSSLKFFRQGEQLDPDKASIQYNLGNLYMTLNMPYKAKQHYCRFLEQDLPDEYLGFALSLKRDYGISCTQ